MSERKREEPVLLRRMSSLRLSEFLKKRYTEKWVLPANKTHILLGTPGLFDWHKTFVEPDGSFSPGVGTFGITSWLYDRKTSKFYAPEEFLLNNLSFSLAEGFLPVGCSEWKAGACRVAIRVFVGWQNDNQREVTDYAEISVINEGKKSAEAYLYLAIRSLGPAGGPVNTINYDTDKRIVIINGKPSVQFDISPESFGTTSFTPEEDDISVWARRGEIPRSSTAEDSTQLGLLSGAARFAVKLAPGEKRTFGLQAAVGDSPLAGNFNSGKVQREMKRVMDWWRPLLTKMQLSITEPFSQDAFYASIGYLLNLSVENEVRVANISYPKPFLRDGVFIINAIDKAGLHDRAREFIDYLINHLWTSAASQYGPEADEPGALAWVIMDHYRLTRDVDWLRSVYPVLKRCASLIEFLWEAEDGQTREESGVRFVVKDNKILASMETELCGIPLKFNVIYAKREDDVIYGRLDLKLQTEWVVPWHITALRGAWEAAEALGHVEDAQHFKTKYESYHDAYVRLTTKHPMNLRATMCIWPCRVLDPKLPQIGDINLKDSYAQRLTENVDQIDEGRSYSNKYPFFEAAHNLLLMGYREYILEHFLERLKYSPQSHEALGTYAFAEVTSEEKWWGARYWTDLWADVRGWSHLGFVIPHGWSSAEFALLMRDMLFFEWNDTLMLAEGVLLNKLPEAKEIGVHNAPTYFGTLDYSLVKQNRRILLKIGGNALPPGGYSLRLGRGMSIDNVSTDSSQSVTLAEDRIVIPSDAREVTVTLS